MLAEGKKHAVFITHDWGKGDLEELGRDNHARAAALNRALTSAGVPTWFDEEKMEGQVDVAMAEGLEESALVLVCVTQRYMEKVKGKNQADNCFTEFSYAVRAHTPANMLCVVMEPRMKRTNTWKGLLAMKLGGNLYADFTDDSKLEAVVRGAQTNILGWIDSKLGSDFRNPVTANVAAGDGPQPREGGPGSAQEESGRREGQGSSVDPNAEANRAVDGEGDTKLTLAAKEGQIGEVQVGAGAERTRREAQGSSVDPNAEANRAVDGEGNTKLTLAAKEGQIGEVTRLLAAPGIDVNQADKDGKTPLYWASWDGHTEVVEALLAAPGIAVNQADKDGETPLCWASKKGHTEVVKALLGAPGIDVNLANTQGRTPLSFASSLGHTEVVEALLAAPGIDVNQADNDGKTPLAVAKKEEIKALLRAAGARA